MCGQPVVDSQGPSGVKDIPATGQPGWGVSEPEQGGEGLPKGKAPAQGVRV